MWINKIVFVVLLARYIFTAVNCHTPHAPNKQPLLNMMHIVTLWLWVGLFCLYWLYVSCLLEDRQLCLLPPLFSTLPPGLKADRTAGQEEHIWWWETVLKSRYCTVQNSVWIISQLISHRKYSLAAGWSSVSNAESGQILTFIALSAISPWTLFLNSQKFQMDSTRKQKLWRIK